VIIKELDIEAFDFIKDNFYSGVISDILDELGLRDQSLDPRIRPIRDDMTVVGWAKTMLSTDIYHIPQKPYEKELTALDEINPGEVAVVSTNFSARTCFWGELLTTLTIRRGGRGAVMDSYTRDAAKILKTGFPLFTIGFRPVDSKGRSEVIDYDCPIEIGGVKIEHHDIIFGDIDGVVVVPQKEAVEVFNKAYQKIHGENKVREEILEGKSIVDIYDKYKIL